MKGILLISLLGLVLSSVTSNQPDGQGTTNAGSEQKALLKLTDDITAAKTRLDTTVLERVLADDFILTNPAGFTATRTEYLAGVRADTATYESVVNQDQIVNVYGDAAVVAGATVVKGRYEGREIGGRFRFTNVYIRRGRGWECVAIHLTRVAQQ